MPKGQRTTTRRNARGSRPSWRATTARSASLLVDTARRMLLAPPLREVLDDEQVLARTDVAEHSRLRREDCVRRRPLQPPLQRVPLLLQPAHGRGLRGLLRMGGHVGAQRLVVEERDERERAKAEPAAGDEPAGAGL